MIYLKHYQSRIIVACFLLFAEYISNCLIVNINNDLYFAVCGLFNVLIIILLPVIQGTNFIDDLMKLNYATLLIQFAGWLMYENYVQPYAYNSMITALNIAQLSRLLWINDDRRTQSCIDWSHFYSFNFYSMGKNTEKKVRKC